MPKLSNLPFGRYLTTNSFSSYPTAKAAAAAAAANGVTSNGKSAANGDAAGSVRRREAADYYVKGDSIAATELHLRKPAFAAAAVASE